MGTFERDGFSIKGGTIRLYRRGDSKSDIWHASVTRPDRKVDRFSTKTVDPVEAGRIAERHLDRLRFAEEFGIPLDQKTFRQVADHWYAEVLERSICDKNKEDYRAILDRYLLPFFGAKVVALIKLKDIIQYRTWRKTYWTTGPGKDITHLTYVRGRKTLKRPAKRCVPSPGTLAREDVVLRGVLQTAIALGYANNHEVLQFKSARSEDNSRGALSKEQYETLVKTAWDRAVDATNRQTRYHRQLLACYVQFMVMTGLRPGEARDLRFRDVKDGYVVLQSSKTKVRKVVGVAGFGSIISFLHDVHHDLYGGDIPDEQENPFPRPTDYLWRDYWKDEPIKDFKRSFNELIAACDIRWDEHQRGKITLYSLRHTYAHFRIVYGGVTDVYLLAQNMGTSVQMIERYYGHLEPLHRKDELKRVHRDADPEKLLEHVGELFGGSPPLTS